MKTKVTTALLIVALALMPINGRADDVPPPENGTVAWACVTLIVGGIMVYGLYRMCKKLPPMNPPEPPEEPPAPPPPNNRTNTNSFRTNLTMRLNMPERALTQTADWQMVTLAFQSSTNMQTWRNDYFVTNWLSQSQLIYVCADGDGIPLLTNSQSISWSNEMVIADLSAVIPPPREPAKAFRMVEIH